MNAGTFRTYIVRRCYTSQYRDLRPDTFYVDTIGVLDFELLKDYILTIDYRDGLIDFVKVKKPGK